MNPFVWPHTSRLRQVALVGLLGGVLAGLFLSAWPARAQFAQESDGGGSGAREVPAEQTVNLFAQWEGKTPVDGLFLTLPAGWHLQKAVAVRGGARHAVLETRPSTPSENEYFIGTDETLRGAAEFVFRVRTGASAPSVRWSLEPFSYRSEERLRRLSRYRQSRRVSVAPATRAADNRVLAFPEARAPVLLDRAQLPSLSTRASFTVEGWLKTTGLDEVVLSTWDGHAERPYPLEWVVDASGRLRSYRGRPGRHESMATTRPVADGTWHHVAVTHDPDAGRTRLLLDGRPVDSLRGTVPLEPSRDGVALGGRVPAASAQAEQNESGDGGEDGASGKTASAAAEAGPGGFTGQFDEVHVWPRARAAAAVRRTMRQPRPAAVDAASGPGDEADGARRFDRGETGPALLHFEDRSWPPEMITRAPDSVARPRSTLRFYAPITELRARSKEGAVTLSWTAPDRGRFVVERSPEGEKNFREVGRRAARDGTQRYSFTDAQAPSEVVFYRIRQVFSGDAERRSGTLKVGRGTSEKKKQAVTLVGNFPNPFSEETTIAYQVRRETHMRLSVWDLTGQRVETLVNETQESGYREAVFQPENLSSGTYFIRLRADGRTHTRKMALVK
jgi:hypothetical protein